MAIRASIMERAMRRVSIFFAILFSALAFAQTMHDHRMPAAANPHTHWQAVQPGQAAFAAIQEIVEILEADPATDWHKVNIDALRQHLIDMDNVTLHAEATGEPIDGGMRFVVSGIGPIRDSVQRMVLAHAKTMNGVGSWTSNATTTNAPAILIVKLPATAIYKLPAP